MIVKNVNLQAFHLINATDSSLNQGLGASNNWSIREAATLLYVMDHISTPQDSLSRMLY
jgi:hypothetical protein